jgi:hypothetical protein
MNKLTSKTRKAFLAAGLLSGAALSSIVLAAPANAADCVAGDVASYQMLTGGECTSGDKTYSNFIFTNLNSADTVTISPGIPTHTIALSNSSGWGAGTYGLSYRVTIDPLAPYYLRAYAASSSSSIFVPSLVSGTIGLTASAMPPLSGTIPLNSGTTVPSFYTTPLTLKTDVFTTEVIVTDGFLTAFDNSIVQGINNTDRVPGPLPLLGAGAAFGFSRRIRNRIKAAV